MEPGTENSIPFHVTVEGNDINAAQFLRLMAEALVNGSGVGKLQVKATDMFWGRDASYYRARSIRDEGVAWTYKPAVLQRRPGSTAHRTGGSGPRLRDNRKP